MASRPKSTTARALAAALLLVALAAAGALAFGPASAGADETPAAAATTGGTITLDSGWTEEPDNLNPFIGYSLVSYHIFWQNYDRLVRYDPDTMEPVPGIAESWEVSDDAKIWTFHIREGVKWQDGEDLTARDVAFTFNYVIDNGPNAFTIYTNHVSKVTATDDYTVVFECSQPRGTLLQMWVPILPEHIWSKISPDDAQNKFPNKPPIVGSGPFQCVEWKRGNYVRMKTWEGYWGGRAKIEEMILHFYTNPDTLAADFDLGVIDMTIQMAAASFPSYENKPGVEAQQAVHDKFDCLELNCYEGPSGGHPALRDPEFRRALAWAIDNEKICEVSYMGFSTPGTTILPSNLWKDPLDYHWEPPADVMRTYDPEKAKQLLDEAGYTDADGDGIREYKGKPITLRLWGDPEVAADSTTGKLITSWFEHIGLDIDFEVIDYGWQMDQVFNYKGDVYYPDWDLAVTYWGGDYDPGFILSVYTGDQVENWNDTGWANEEYDRLYKEQDATVDPSERLDMVHRMQEICYDQVPVIPFGYGKDLDVHNTADWEGWVKMPAGNGSVVNMWNYLSVHPRESGDGGDEETNTGLIVGIVVAAGVIGSLAAFLIARQRRAGRREED